MKCQNCGRSEVSFHYSSNINGNVTETYLCSECATKTGYGFDRLLTMENVFNGFLPFFGKLAGTVPMSMPVLGGYVAQPFMPTPQVELYPQSGSCNCGCEKKTQDVPCTEVDDEMKKRREINMLHEQMRLAAKSDDFEKAIELREKIKEMES